MCVFEYMFCDVLEFGLVYFAIYFRTSDHFCIVISGFWILYCSRVLSHNQSVIDLMIAITYGLTTVI